MTLPCDGCRVLNVSDVAKEHHVGRVHQSLIELCQCFLFLQLGLGLGESFASASLPLACFQLGDIPGLEVGKKPMRRSRRGCARTNSVRKPKHVSFPCTSFDARTVFLRSRKDVTISDYVDLVAGVAILVLILPVIVRVLLEYCTNSINSSVTRHKESKIDEIWRSHKSH